MYLGTTENKLWDKLILPPIHNNCSRHSNNYLFCNLIWAFKSDSDPVSRDKKGHSEPPDPGLLSHVRWSGNEASRWHYISTNIKSQHNVTYVTVQNSMYKFNEEYAASHTPFINHVTTCKKLQHENFVIRFFMKMMWSHIVMIFSLFSTDCMCPENKLYCAQILNSNTDTTMELRRRTEPSWEGWSKPKQKGVKKLLRNVVNLPPLSWSVRWPPWGPPGWRHLGPGPSDSPCRYEPGEQRDLDIKSPPRVTKPFNGVMSSWVVIPQRERYGVHTERGALGA